jgi:hypothetical protein
MLRHLCSGNTNAYDSSTQTHTGSRTATCWFSLCFAQACAQSDAATCTSASSDPRSEFTSKATCWDPRCLLLLPTAKVMLHLLDCNSSLLSLKTICMCKTHSLHNSCHNHQHDLRYHDHRTQWTTRNPGGKPCRYCSINSQQTLHAKVFRTITPLAGSAAAAAAAGLTAAPAQPAILGPTPRWSVPCVALQRFPATASTAAADAAEH